MNADGAVAIEPRSASTGSTGRLGLYIGLAVLLAGIAALLVWRVVAGSGIAFAQNAAQTWEVQVGGGGDQPAGAPPEYEANGYGPNPLEVHVGDTVKWNFAGGHTVTFNSGHPELALIMPGANPGELQLGPAFGPVGPTGPNISYDGTAQLSSGIQEPGSSYSLTFTKTGMFGYVCTLHPGMRGEIIVRQADAPLPESPAQAKARGEVTLRTLAGKAKIDAQMVRPVDAGSVHVALAGIGDGFGASALEFVNGDRTIRRGDAMVWTNADPFEIHTVTFTSGATPPEFVQPRPQPSGPPMLVIAANVAGPAGGDTYTGQGYANSGILPPGGSYVLRFDAPPGTYNYLCVVHPWMTGKITVSG